MEISGTLHFYSGGDKELFFVFDVDVAQQLYRMEDFDVDDPNSRRAYVSIGRDRFIHQRTLSFSKKQTEIKISLCALRTKNDLGALTALYDWFSHRGAHPSPFALLGTLRREQWDGDLVWELRVTEPVGLISPPGLGRRRKAGPRERRSFQNRRRIVQREMEAGRPAEELALALAVTDFPGPDFVCLWRDDFLDSERIEIRTLGVLADIDVWNVARNAPELFIEVKAQKVMRRRAQASFYLSVGEWRSYERAMKAKIPYQLWLFQYRDLTHFAEARDQVELVVFSEIRDGWLDPDGYLVTPENGYGERHRIA
jgi:hypothetical protein